MLTQSCRDSSCISHVPTPLPSSLHNTGAAREERDSTDQRGQGSDPSQDRVCGDPLDATSPPSLEGGDSQGTQPIPLPPAGAGPCATPPPPPVLFRNANTSGKGVAIEDVKFRNTNTSGEGDGREEVKFPGTVGFGDDHPLPSPPRALTWAERVVSPSVRRPDAGKGVSGSLVPSSFGAEDMIFLGDPLAGQLPPWKEFRVGLKDSLDGLVPKKL